MKKLKGFEKGMGIGGWLTNYKRFNALPLDKRLDITIGDMEHFESYITEWDVKNNKRRSELTVNGQLPAFTS